MIRGGGPHRDQTVICPLEGDEAPPVATSLLLEDMCMHFRLAEDVQMCSSCEGPSGTFAASKCDHVISLVNMNQCFPFLPSFH